MPYSMVVTMLSLNSVRHSPERPRGIVAIIAVCGSLSAIAWAFFVLLLAQRVPLSAGASLLGGGLEQLGPVAFLLYGVALAVLAVALWRRWRGARRAAIVVAAAGVALAIPAISSAVVDGRTLAIAREGLQIMVRVIVIFYLSQEPVKDWFTNL